MSQSVEQKAEQANLVYSIKGFKKHNHRLKRKTHFNKEAKWK